MNCFTSKPDRESRSLVEICNFLSPFTTCCLVFNLVYEKYVMQQSLLHATTVWHKLHYAWIQYLYNWSLLAVRLADSNQGWVEERPGLQESQDTPVGLLHSWRVVSNPFALAALRPLVFLFGSAYHRAHRWDLSCTSYTLPVLLHSWSHWAWEFTSMPMTPGSTGAAIRMTRSPLLHAWRLRSGPWGIGCLRTACVWIMTRRSLSGSELANNFRNGI